MNIDAVLLSGILLTGIIMFGYLMSQSIKKPVIAYFLLQLTVVWIFFGQAVLSPLGLDFKPHAVAFLLGAVISFYYIFKNFDWLWAYKPFRYLFIFSVISSIYAVCYKTDFRSSNYIDLWIHNNLGLKHSAIGAGLGQVGREFGSGETKYIVYMAGLAPLVAFVSGLLCFKGRFDRSKITTLISLISFTISGYFVALGFSLLAKTSTFMFMEGRLAINGGFTGGDFEGLMLIMLVGLYYFLEKNKDFRLYTPAKWSILSNIVLLSALILLGIKKGTIISVLLASVVVIGLVYAVKIYYKEQLELKIHPAVIIIPVLLIGIPLLISPEFLDDTFYKITERFSSNDTLDVRWVNWELYTQYWADNLSFLKALFGFGIDTSREAIFFLSAMHPDPSMQQPHIHNIYLEMFYNYGLVAVLFFLPLVLITWKNFKSVIANNYNVFQLTSIAAIVFFFSYFMTESPAVPSIITIFSLVGFLEATGLDS